MNRQTKRCIFCSASLRQRKSKEHVFARWLLRELDIEKAKMAATHRRSTGEVASQRVHSLKQLLTGNICRNCNSGWMSNLEREIGPALKMLMRNQLLLSDLSLDLRKSLARWTAKTAYCLNYASNFPFRIPSAHLHALASGGRLPDGVIVLGQHHLSSEPFYWVQSSSWHFQFKNDFSEEQFGEAVKGAYKMVLQFKNLILLIAFWPLGGWKFVMRWGVHLPIWPHRGPCGWYIGKEPFSWTDSVKALVEFHLGLGIAQEGTIPHLDLIQPGSEFPLRVNQNS